MRLYMAEPGVNPVENPRPRPEPPRFSFFFWASCVGLAILVIWGVFIRPMTANAAQDEPPASITATATPDCVDPKFCPVTATPTPTQTPTAGCNQAGGDTRIVEREVTRLAPVRITQIVKETQIVPGDPVTVPVQVTRNVEVTRVVVITTTPGPTATPEPTQTPWFIEVTRIVEITQTPTMTPTATPEPTQTPTDMPTSIWWTPEPYPAP